MTEQMAELNFKTLAFSKVENGLKVTLLKLFTTKIPNEELEKIDGFKVKDGNTVSFKNEKNETRFLFLLSKYLESDLKNNLTGNKTTYIHRNSGIPLIGNVSFGIVYRNSSIIEIKPVTSCNLNCVYCSISEGLESKKHDFVVEKDYLVEELIKLIKFVGEKVEIHVGVQGEPFLYSDLEELIKDVQKIKEVTRISIDTNGTLLTKKILDNLAKNDKLQLNFSLDAVEEQKAREMAGTKNYNVAHVKEMIEYAAGKLSKVLIAPVRVQDYNDQEIEKIIEFAKSVKEKTGNMPILGIQNYLRYKTGKTPAKVLPWEKFYALLDEWEVEHDVRLRLDKEFFEVRKTRELEKPFVDGDVVSAVLKCPDRFNESSIAVAKGRTISIPDCRFVKEKEVKVKIFRDKHNIFNAKLV